MLENADTTFARIAQKLVHENIRREVILYIAEKSFPTFFLEKLSRVLDFSSRPVFSFRARVSFPPYTLK